MPRKSISEQFFAWLGQKIERPIQDLPPMPVLIRIKLSGLKIQGGEVEIPATVDFPKRENR